MTQTIVMIHGMWGGAWCWDSYKAFFESRGYRCLTPTLRHHDISPGLRPPHALGETSLLDYADDLARELERLDERPVIMGHSMGGLLAQMLAGRGMANALVLLSSAAPAGIFSLRLPVLKSFRSVMMKWGYIPRWGFWKKPHRQTFAESVFSTLHKLDEQTQQSVYENFVSESGRAAFEIGFWLFDSRRAAAVDASAITCPVLLVAGRDDRMTPVPVIRRIAERYSDVATYKEFENHAHWLIGEPGWEEIAGYIAGWLESAERKTQ